MKGTLREFFPKKVSMPKKLKGESFSVARYCLLRGKKRKNLYGSVPWANRYNFVVPEKFVELFWPLQVYRKKH